MGQNALDTYQNNKVIENAEALVAHGYGAVGMYYFTSSAFKELLTKAVAQAVSKHLWVFSIWENGTPTSGNYFASPLIGTKDANAAHRCAQNATQPANTPIYFAVDYDASEQDLTHHIIPYFEEINSVLRLASPKYTPGVYGSGLVCSTLKARGLVTHTFLSESTGFRGSKAFLVNGNPNIVQHRSQKLFDMDVDIDTTNGNAGGWKI